MKLKGQIKIIKFKSKVLENNPLKDPHVRDLLVYLPEKYSGRSGGYPTIFLLPSFGNNNYSTVNNNPFSLTIYQILENLIQGNKCGEMIIVIVAAMRLIVWPPLLEWAERHRPPFNDFLPLARSKLYHELGAHVYMPMFRICSA